MSKYKVLSLFSGCGGLDLGFIKAGFEVVWANDFGKEAVKTYKNNIGDHIVLDNIYNVDETTLPQADIIIGWFPCLGFTVAQGKNRSIDNKQNQLYKEYARVLRAVQPKYFVVENVTGIKSGTDFENFFHNEILKSFRDAGINGEYKIKYDILVSSDYGVPQNRKRIIIIGTRSDIEAVPTFPEVQTKEKITLRDAICDLPKDFDDNISNHSGGKHKVKINGYVGNRQLNWDKPSPTITGRGSRSGGAVIHPHPDRHRRLSVRECARIQSFPDNFLFYGSNSACFSQIGNAVPPLMSFAIANEFKKTIDCKVSEINIDDWELPYIQKIKEQQNA